jgi:hypothetical protein
MPPDAAGPKPGVPAPGNPLAAAAAPPIGGVPCVPGGGAGGVPITVLGPDEPDRAPGSGGGAF